MNPLQFLLQLHGSSRYSIKGLGQIFFDFDFDFDFVIREQKRVGRVRKYKGAL